MRLGYIGLGNMGGALARRLLRTHALVVYDRNPQAVALLTECGAEAAPDARTLAARCDMVMTCLPTSAEVTDVLFGDGGLAGALAPGSVVADMTTGDPIQTRALAARLAASGVHLIDAPVAGSLASVEAGTIAIMLGGEAPVIERCRPVMAAVSSNIFHVGETGTAHAMKLVNNVVSAGMRAVLFEAVALGVKNGLPLATCAAVLNVGSARSHTTEVALPRVVRGDFTPTFTLGLMHKDVTLATRLGEASGTPMLVANLVRELFQMAIGEFGADADVNRLAQLFERQSRIRLVPEPNFS
jgi:3-hydroxyisobutyrate dehydrogenase